MQNPKYNHFLVRPGIAGFLIVLNIILLPKVTLIVVAVFGG
jgi:hypothetical protein